MSPVTTTRTAGTVAAAAHTVTRVGRRAERLPPPRARCYQRPSEGGAVVTRSAVIRRIFLSVATLALLAAQDARAQTCGDADGGGSVTVTDGVQVLRSVAGLSSTC